ncbi:monoamine oxidase [Mucilaginibacter gracilis]|uniref:Tryptophan 2-monooxygenase n=2 Tax=Mucilaginibacter gracilis TaxID=423350 RepID=A0A495JA79_9SPHI|nr:monoamine oxidase [Mucilaginibacter gracilis]
MQQAHVLVIGAGAAGLMAAMQLSRKGKKVLVLEASSRAGGRIHTLNGEGFTQPVELGAEFVHGQLPVTLALLNQAKIPYHSAVGDMWRYRDGRFQKSEQFLPHYDVIIKKLNALQTDITLHQFLTTHLAAKKYTETCNMLRSFAAGYDNADPMRFSAFAMRSELQSEDDNHQYRIQGGYAAIIAYLEAEIVSHGGQIYLSTIVKQLHWQPGQVVAVADDGREFKAQKVIIALPLGVLQAHKQQPAAITFVPPIPKQEQAIQQMGMGAVIKLLLQFDEVFWERQALKKGADHDIKNMSYLFSGEAIPTWWTQTPHPTSMLTGWLGGPPAAELKDATDDYILELGLLSLSNIYDVPLTQLRQKLQAYQVMNWLAQPFTMGSYSYATTATGAARELLLQPEAQTIYFAGEALYDGPEMGTVEAALASGKHAANAAL